MAGEKDLIQTSPETNGEEVTEELVDDFADVAGQPKAKQWALEVTAAGGHNILIFVPNGTHH